MRLTSEGRHPRAPARLNPALGGSSHAVAHHAVHPVTHHHVMHHPVVHHGMHVVAHHHVVVMVHHHRLRFRRGDGRAEGGGQDDAGGHQAFGFCHFVFSQAAASLGWLAYGSGGLRVQRPFVPLKPSLS